MNKAMDRIPEQTHIIFLKCFSNLCSFENVILKKKVVENVPFSFANDDIHQGNDDYVFSSLLLLLLF